MRTTRRRFGRAATAPPVVALAVALAVGAAGACGGDGDARTCVERDGAAFCVGRQGRSALEPAASGLEPGSTLTVQLLDAPVASPARTSTVTAAGVPDGIGVIGVLSAYEPVDLGGARVLFAGTPAGGSPVEVTVAAPG